MEAEIITVTVTYNPDLAILSSQLSALPEHSLKIIIDNHSSKPTGLEISQAIAAWPNIHFVANSVNRGLAAAINQGVQQALTLAPNARFLFLLDQDSEPDTHCVKTLLSAFQELHKQELAVGCVGPQLIDPATGLAHGFHQAKGWRWLRLYPKNTDSPVACSNLNGSGLLMQVALFQELGGLDEAFFIDHVDTEWAFRVLNAGFSLWGIPAARMYHRMGQESLRYWWFGWRLWPCRSPLRHRYLFRNAVLLMRRSYVPLVWKAWAVVKLMLTFCVHAVFDRQRSQQIQAMIGGVRTAFNWKKRLKE